jgi:hypothetical protein
MYVLYVSLRLLSEYDQEGKTQGRKDAKTQRKKMRIQRSPSGEIKDPSDQTYYIHTHQTSGQSTVNEEREMCVFILRFMVYLCSC